MKKIYKRNKMFFNIILVSIIVLALFGCIAEFSTIEKFLWFYPVEYLPNIFLNSFWEYMSAPIVTLIIGLLITQKYNLKQLEITNQNRIDGASGWRKELMIISSKSEISSDDIHRIRSSLRYLPKSNDVIFSKFLKQCTASDECKKKLQAISTSEISYIDKENNLSILNSYINSIESLNEAVKIDTHLKRENIDLQFDLMTNLMISYCDSFPEGKFVLKNDKIIKITRISARYLLKNHWEYYINLTNLDDDEKFVESMQFVSLDILKKVKKTYENY